jgi:hypothetical protein
MNANGAAIFIHAGLSQISTFQVSQEIYLAGLQATVILQALNVFAAGMIHSGFHGSTSHRYNISRQHPLRC